VTITETPEWRKRRDIYLHLFWTLPYVAVDVSTLQIQGHSSKFVFLYVFSQVELRGAIATPVVEILIASSVVRCHMWV
jgi:hypothetical protein